MWYKYGKQGHKKNKKNKPKQELRKYVHCEGQYLSEYYWELKKVHKKLPNKKKQSKNLKD